MEVIMPFFKNQEEKNLLIVLILLSLVLGFIPFLLEMLFLSDKLEKSSKNISKAFLNFSLSFFLICTLIKIIPFIGGYILALIGGIVFLIYVMIVILALASISNNQPVKIPVILKIIQ